MSPSCSCRRPSCWLWQHGLSRPHPPSPATPPPPLLLDCLSILIPPASPPLPTTPHCTQQIGTPAALSPGCAFHQAVTQPPSLAVFIIAASVTPGRIWWAACACVLLSQDSSLGWARQAPPESPAVGVGVYSACQKPARARVTELVVQNKSLRLLVHLIQMGPLEKGPAPH